MAPMFEFDEDRPSISGRKISSNIPPTVPEYETFRPYLKWLLMIFLVPVLILFIFVLFYR